MTINLVAFMLLLNISIAPVFSQEKPNSASSQTTRLPPLWSTGAATTGAVIELQRPVPEWTGYFEIAPKPNSNIPIIASFTRLGETCLRRGEYSLARQCFDAALSYSPKFPATYLGLGIADFELGNTDAAINNLNTSLRLNPKSISAFVFRSLIAIKTNHPDQALVDLNNALDNFKHADINWSQASQKKLKILIYLRNEITYLINLYSQTSAPNAQTSIDKSYKEPFFDELSIQE